MVVDAGGPRDSVAACRVVVVVAGGPYYLRDGRDAQTPTPRCVCSAPTAAEGLRLSMDQRRGLGKRCQLVDTESDGARRVQSIGRWMCLWSRDSVRFGKGLALSL